MGTKTSPAKAKKEDRVSFKTLLPGLLLGTAVVVTIGLIGRKATKT